MKKVILTVIITLVLIFAVFIAYIYSGAYDVSQLTTHNKITKWMIRTTKHHSISKRLKDIKMTSMPAFGPTHTDQKIWAITGFLLNKMNKMSPEEYQAWIKKYSEWDAAT
jgi:hypothetical protein